MTEESPSLQDYAERTGRSKPGFQGVWDQITPEHRAEAIAGYRSGIPAPTIRKWLQTLYPEMEFRQTQVDSFLYKQHGRARD